MIMLALPESDVKGLMNMLLVKETFDAFELRTAAVQTFARFDIEGAPPAQLPEEGMEAGKPVEPRGYCLWGTIRPYVYGIIKNGGKPRFMKLVLALPQDKLERFDGAQALFINVTFDKNQVVITTGTAMRSFSLDKTVETKWDEYVTAFFGRSGFRPRDGV